MSEDVQTLQNKIVEEAKNEILRDIRDLFLNITLEELMGICNKHNLGIRDKLGSFISYNVTKEYILEKNIAKYTELKTNEFLTKVKNLEKEVENLSRRIEEAGL